LQEQKCRAFPEIDAKKVRTMEERKEPRASEIPGKQRNIEKKIESCKLEAAAFVPKRKLTNRNFMERLATRKKNKR
jgi:hypothetical protein